MTADLTPETIELCAEAAHEVNRVYCVSIGDHSQKYWKDAAEWQRASMRKGVIEAANGATPRRMHESWMEVKAADGWTYGEVKDAEKKTHPCMVDYDLLPAAQRKKDYLNIVTVRSLLLALVAGDLNIG